MVHTGCINHGQTGMVAVAGGRSKHTPCNRYHMHNAHTTAAPALPQPTGSSEDCHSRQCMTPVSSNLGPDLGLETYTRQSSTPMLRCSTDHEYSIDTDHDLDDLLGDLLRSASGAARASDAAADMQQQLQPVPTQTGDHRSSQQHTRPGSPGSGLSGQPVLPDSAAATAGQLLLEQQQQKQHPGDTRTRKTAGNTVSSGKCCSVLSQQQAQQRGDTAGAFKLQTQQQQQPVTLLLEPLGPPLPCSSEALAKQILQQQQQQQPVQLLGPFSLTSQPRPCQTGSNMYQSVDQMIATSQQQQQQQQRVHWECQQLPLVHSLLQVRPQQQQQASMTGPDLTASLPDLTAHVGSNLPSSSSTHSAMAPPGAVTPAMYMRAHAALQQRLQAAYNAGHWDGTQHALQLQVAQQRQRHQQQQTVHKQHQLGSCSLKRPLQELPTARSNKKARSVTAKPVPVMAELLASDRESAAARLRNMSDRELLLLAGQVVRQKVPCMPT